MQETKRLLILYFQTLSNLLSIMKKKFVCTVCGYIHEGPEPPAECPICHVGPDKFEEYKG